MHPFPVNVLLLSPTHSSQPAPGPSRDGRPSGLGSAGGIRDIHGDPGGAAAAGGEGGSAATPMDEDGGSSHARVTGGVAPVKRPASAPLGKIAQSPPHAVPRGEGGGRGPGGRGKGGVGMPASGAGNCASLPLELAAVIDGGPSTGAGGRPRRPISAQGVAAAAAAAKVGLRQMSAFIRTAAMLHLTFFLLPGIQCLVVIS